MARKSEKAHVWMLRRVRGEDGKALPVRTDQKVSASFARALYATNRAEPYSGQDLRARPQDLSRLSVDELEARIEDSEIDRESIEGTGSNGNVVKADLVRALESLDAQEDEDEDDDEDDEDDEGDEGDEGDEDEGEGEGGADDESED